MDTGSILSITHADKSPRAAALLKAIQSFIAQNQVAPTLRELMGLTGLTTTSVIAFHLARLEEDQLIDRFRPGRGTARNIRITERGRQWLERQTEMSRRHGLLLCGAKGVKGANEDER